MQHAHVLGCLHALILVALAWRTAGRAVTIPSRRLCATYILVWFNLVITSLSLAVFSQLDRVGLYFWVSTLLAAGLAALADHWAGASYKADLMPATRSGASRIDQVVRGGLLLTLCLAAVATALICLHYVPNNWDTCTYRLSRAFFYLGQGNLLHTGNPEDPRLSYYPFNGALWYLFLAVYQSPALVFNVIPALAWIFAGLGTFSLASRLGASNTGAMVAAWICMMSPGVLVQAASGNDEVQTAVPILIGIGFAADWLSTEQRKFAPLAGIGIGLGMGTKLHWVFYSLFVATVILLLLLRAARRPEFRSLLSRQAPAAFVAALFACPLVVSFMLCNYLSAGEIAPNEFNRPVLNTPFRFSLAGEKLLTNTGELLLSPIPDLVPPVHPEQRQPAYSAFNKFFMDCCFKSLVEVTKRHPFGYKFVGPADQLGYQPNETTVWLGFFPHLLLVVCLTQLFTRKLPLAALVPLIAFFFWHATFAILLRYTWWAGTYYSFPAVIAAAGLGPIWDFTRAHRGVAARLLVVAFLAVFATHTLLAGNLLVFGGLRNVRFLWQGGPASPEMHAVEPSVVAAIQDAHKVYIPNTHWEILYWNFMRFNPAAAYHTGLRRRLPEPGTLMLLSISPDVAGGVFPARLPQGTTPALTYLGIANGDSVFAQGDRIETRYPDRSRYVLIQVRWRNNAIGREVAAVECCTGLDPSDQYALRYTFESRASGRSVVSDWYEAGKSYLSQQTFIDQYDSLLVETRTKRDPGLIVRTSYDLDHPWRVTDTQETTASGIQKGGTVSKEASVVPAASVAPPLLVNIPTLAPEPYSYQGKSMTVSWLRAETILSITNFGRQSRAAVELQLSTFGKPHTAVLQAHGKTAGSAHTISRVLWVNGWETVRFNVGLSPGENRFVLRSRETADKLPDGRDVCFLLIGSPKIVADDR